MKIKNQNKKNEEIKKKTKLFFLEQKFTLLNFRNLESWNLKRKRENFQEQFSPVQKLECYYLNEIFDERDFS